MQRESYTPTRTYDLLIIDACWFNLFTVGILIEWGAFYMSDKANCQSERRQSERQRRAEDREDRV